MEDLKFQKFKTRGYDVAYYQHTRVIKFGVYCKDIKIIATDKYRQEIKDFYETFR